MHMSVLTSEEEAHPQRRLLSSAMCALQLAAVLLASCVLMIWKASYRNQMNHKDGALICSMNIMWNMYQEAGFRHCSCEMRFEAPDSVPAAGGGGGPGGGNGGCSASGAT